MGHWYRLPGCRFKFRRLPTPWLIAREMHFSVNGIHCGHTRLRCLSHLILLSRQRHLCRPLSLIIPIRLIILSRQCHLCRPLVGRIIRIWNLRASSFHLRLCLPYHLFRPLVVRTIRIWNLRASSFHQRLFLHWALRYQRRRMLAIRFPLFHSWYLGSTRVHLI